jgi:hypothetical protein
LFFDKKTLGKGKFFTTHEKCIDPTVSARIMPLMQMPQREFSSSTLGAGAGDCKSQSSH